MNCLAATVEVGREVIGGATVVVDGSEEGIS